MGSNGRSRDMSSRVACRQARQSRTFVSRSKERRKIDELLATLNFKTGPTPGRWPLRIRAAAHDVSAVDNPLAQPYRVQSRTAADDSGREPRWKIPRRAGGGRHHQIGARARGSVRAQGVEAVAEYCGAKPNNGAGIGSARPVPRNRTLTAEMRRAGTLSGPAWREPRWVRLLSRHLTRALFLS